MLAENERLACNFSWPKFYAQHLQRWLQLKKSAKLRVANTSLSSEAIVTILSIAFGIRMQIVSVFSFNKRSLIIIVCFNFFDRIISPWHDIPHFANENARTYNMICEVPRWTNAKLEVAVFMARILAIWLLTDGYKEESQRNSPRCDRR